MVASIGRITSGTGYRYLTSEVATSRSDYYTGRGEAPGRWAGAGAGRLGLDGEVAAHDMAALFGRFVDPRSVGVLDASGQPVEETVLGRRVSVRLRADGSKLEPVAAFDLTFSPSKSVSVLWATATDPSVRDAVVDAHEHAVATALAYVEANAGHARAGENGIRRVEGTGLVVAQFRHRTARATTPGEVGDPQLHSHCAILNRVQGVDGVWRTLDSKAIYRHAHAAGALYAATLETELIARVGVAWQTPAGKVPMRELVGIPDRAIKLWSSRRAQVVARFERMLDDWHASTGRSPTRAERAGMLDDATLRSRPAKTHGDVDLHARWRTQLTPTEQATIDSIRFATLTASTGGRLPAGSHELADAVICALEGQRAWWTRAHVFAETARLAESPSPETIELEVERVLSVCLDLEPDDDRTYAQWDATKYTSPAIRDAETRVLASTGELAAWHVPVDRAVGLGDDQHVAVMAIAEGSNAVTVVIGPAGAGKTTMLRAVADAYATAKREVVVLTLSAAAARVVTDETAVPASTLASWRIGAARIPTGGLVIVDEASMVPTKTLDRLIAEALSTDCRVAIIGDYAQMGSPEAGGLLHDLAALPNAVHLTNVRRFSNEWERDASVALRERDLDITKTYVEHGRIHPTTTHDAVDQTAAAWLVDILAGHDSIITVDTAALAADLSARCQQHLTDRRLLGGSVAIAADGNTIRTGDLIQTRQNTHALATSTGARVLNRDTWIVTGASEDGTITAKHTTSSTAVTIPPSYLSEHVVLGYATTVAGAQGRTTDTAHTLITPRTSASALYVGMTRGRRANHAHVITDDHDNEEVRTGQRTAADAFNDALRREPDRTRSATSVAEQWRATASARAKARADDRLRQHATRSWQHVERVLSTNARAALEGRHGDIIDRLVRVAPVGHQHALTDAIARTNWLRPNPADQFIQLLTTPANSGDQHADSAAVLHVAER